MVEFTVLISVSAKIDFDGTTQPKYRVRKFVSFTVDATWKLSGKQQSISIHNAKRRLDPVLERQRLAHS